MVWCLSRFTSAASDFSEPPLAFSPSINTEGTPFTEAAAKFRETARGVEEVRSEPVVEKTERWEEGEEVKTKSSSFPENVRPRIEAETVIFKTELELGLTMLTSFPPSMANAMTLLGEIAVTEGTPSTSKVLSKASSVGFL